MCWPRAYFPAQLVQVSDVHHWSSGFVLKGSLLSWSGLFGQTMIHCNMILWLLYWVAITHSNSSFIFLLFFLPPVQTDCGWTHLLGSCLNFIFRLCNMLSLRHCCDLWIIFLFSWVQIVLSTADINMNMCTSSQVLMCCDRILPTSFQRGSRQMLTFLDLVFVWSVSLSHCLYSAVRQSFNILLIKFYHEILSGLSRKHICLRVKDISCLRNEINASIHCCGCVLRVVY